MPATSKQPRVIWVTPDLCWYCGLVSTTSCALHSDQLGHLYWGISRDVPGVRLVCQLISSSKLEMCALPKMGLEFCFRAALIFLLQHAPPFP